MPDDQHVIEARAVYDASSERYVEFVGTEISATIEGAVDRSMLAAFTELVSSSSGSRVLDAGCGPGRVAARLAAAALDVHGLDLSLAMLEEARRAHPDIALAQGRLDRLPLASHSADGVVCWYSIIYTPPERLDDVVREMARVLVGGGHLLLAFQAGDGCGLHRTDAHGTGLALTSYQHAVADITDRLERTGFEMHATAVRNPSFEHETTPQAFLIARRTRVNPEE